MGLSLFHINEQVDDLLRSSVDTETGEIDENAILALETLEVERHDKIVAVACFIKSKLAEAEAVKDEKKALDARAKRYEAHAERMRKYLEGSLDRGETVKDPRCEIVWRKSTAVMITDEKKLAKKFWRKPEPPPPAPDKRAIGEALKEGRKVAGATLEHRDKLGVK